MYNLKKGIETVVPLTFQISCLEDDSKLENEDEHIHNSRNTPNNHLYLSQCALPVKNHMSF